MVCLQKQLNPGKQYCRYNNYMLVALEGFVLVMLEGEASDSDNLYAESYTSTLEAPRYSHNFLSTLYLLHETRVRRTIPSTFRNTWVTRRPSMHSPFNTLRYAMITISPILRLRFTWSHLFCWIKVGAHRLVQYFQNCSVIVSMRVILALKDGFVACPPEFFDFDLPSSRQFGVRILISESVPGMTPNGCSLSKSAAREKQLLSTSDTDIRWLLTLRSIAFFADLMRASTAPDATDCRLDLASTHNQLKLPLGQNNLFNIAPDPLQLLTGQPLIIVNREKASRNDCVISKHRLGMYCTTTKVSEYDTSRLSCLHLYTKWVWSKQIKQYWCEWRRWFQTRFLIS